MFKKINTLKSAQNNIDFKSDKQEAVTILFFLFKNSNWCFYSFKSVLLAKTLN